MKELKIVSYNIHNGNLGKNVTEIAFELKKLELDVIALQEVDRNCERSRCIDMCSEMANSFFSNIIKAYL